ncbi:MAG: recombinase A [Deltaproteobacteria bacterium]|nr:recombinase A [Deltaproteobacteria bacterium]
MAISASIEEETRPLIAEDPAPAAGRQLASHDRGSRRLSAEGPDPTPREQLQAPAWDLPELAGRLTELSARPGATALLSWAADLLWKAQQREEPAAWVSAHAAPFFPPDFAAAGIDLAALPFIRTNDAAAAARAADKLLRSGAFGLVIVDLGAGALLPTPLLGRLLGLARAHNAAVVFIAEERSDATSLAPIISLRLTTSRRRVAPDRFACTIEAIKDKRRGPGWTLTEHLRGPAGLR